MPTIVTDDYEFAYDQTVVSAGTAFEIDADEPLNFVNYGQIHAGNSNRGSYVAAIEDSGGMAQLLNRSWITVDVNNDGGVPRDAYGFRQGTDGSSLGGFLAHSNEGRLIVRSEAQSVGIESQRFHTEVDNRGGLISVEGRSAVGIALAYGGLVINEGTIEVDGSQDATAVRVSNADAEIANLKSIRAVSQDGQSIGIEMQNTSIEGMTVQIINHGRLEADVAIIDRTLPEDSDLTVVASNSGTIVGDIILGDGSDQIVNEGLIQGDIDMGGGGDLIDLRRGVVDGSVAGGDGDDLYLIDDASVQLVETSATGGEDTVQSSVSFTLRGYIENLQLTGSRDLTARGNALDNILVGNKGDNFMRGGLGADTLTGGLGDDRYYVDNVGDQVIELSSQGRDWVFSSISWALGVNLEALSLTGDAWINATGNSKGNAIYGNAGRNVITGGKGGDVMTGKASSDTFVFTSVLDSTLADSDRITDLNDGSDKIDLRQIDGDVNTAGVQGFTIVDAFSGHAGELVLAYDASTDITSLTVDVNGDGQADMLVRLNGEHESFDRFLFGGG